MMKNLLTIYTHLDKIFLMKLASQSKVCILEAALMRFQRFGYGKTTMAEIAGDCGMSAANIYRYFECKLDIGIAITMRFYEETDKDIKRILYVPDLGSAEMLEELIVEVNRAIIKIISGSPPLIEMINDLCSKREDLVFYHINYVNGIIAEVLERGVKNAEFDIEDVKKTADQIRTATVAFNAPPVVGMYLRLFATERREQNARELVRLIVSAFKRR